MQAESLGGKRLMGPVEPTPEIMIGQFADPEGNVIGVVNSADVARAPRAVRTPHSTACATARTNGAASGSARRTASATSRPTTTSAT